MAINKSFRNNACFQPLGGQRLSIMEGRFFIHLVLVKEQLSQVVSRKAIQLLYFFPKICRTFVHADDIAEVDIFLTFSHDDLFSTNIAQIESWFCFHTHSC